MLLSQDFQTVCITFWVSSFSYGFHQSFPRLVEGWVRPPSSHVVSLLR